MNNTSFIKEYFDSSLESMIISIKYTLLNKHIKTIFDEDQWVRPSELRKLSMSIFRLFVKEIADEYSRFLDTNHSRDFYRYITRMNTKQLVKKFRYNEINYFYAVEVANILVHRLPNK